MGSVLVALAGTIFAAAAAWPGAAQGALDSREARGSIRQMQRLSSEEAWVLTDTAVLFTRDGGMTWSDVASGQWLEDVTDSFFLSASRGWLAGVSSGSPELLVVFDTADGGVSWRECVVEASALASGQVYARARVNFLDAAHGWVLGQVATSSAFSIGELLRTTDGGATWECLPRPPAAGRFVFVDSEHGYLTGGPVSERLYRTLDGGRSWQELELPITVEKGVALYDLPTFHSPMLGTLAVSLRGDSPRVLTFVTRDGGGSWLPASSTALPPGDYDEPAPIALGESGGVLAVAGQGMVAFAQADTLQALPLAPRESGRRHFVRARAVSVRTLALAADGAAWALIAEGGCERGICRQVTRLVAVDGSDRATEPVEDLLVRTQEAPVLEKKLAMVSDGAVISLDMGFDKCAAGTAAQMQTWWDHSPYRDANIYFGGAARACSQVNLDPSWVETVFDQGWGLIPTWVGPQAPCTRFIKRFSSDPAEARIDGLAEADAAVAAAAALGLGAGTPLYYDFEYYDENDESCSAAVREFVNAWTERVGDHSYLAGAYGNARNVQNDWIPGIIASPPDAVWLTPWVCGRTSSCDWTPTVFGVPGLDDEYWGGYRRIRQYWGPHTETYGGVTFEIDGDYANGPVAAADTSPSCRQVVPAGHWVGEYFDNIDLSGRPAMIRNDGTGFLDFSWNNGSPSSACGVPADNFSVRWTRSVSFNGETYRFKVTSDNGFRLYVDGNLKLEASTVQGPTDYRVDVALAAGKHIVELEYWVEDGSAVAQLSWRQISNVLRAKPDSRVMPVGWVPTHACGHKVMTTLPWVWPSSTYRIASGASFRLYVLSMTGVAEPDPMRSFRASKSF